MRLPLLINARPSVIKDGARVSLGNGVWLIIGDVQDSILDVIYEKPHITPNGQGYSKNVIEDIFGNRFSDTSARLEGPCIVQIFMKKPGTEKSISIYAEFAKP